MNIKLNEKSYEVEPDTALSTFIENLGINTKGVAIAINYEVIPKNKWQETTLTDGTEMMLIHAVSGG